jgi:hypothetical protein
MTARLRGQCANRKGGTTGAKKNRPLRRLRRRFCWERGAPAPLQSLSGAKRRRLPFPRPLAGGAERERGCPEGRED